MASTGTAATCRCLALKYPNDSWLISSSVSCANTSRACGPHSPIQQVPGEISVTVTSSALRILLCRCTRSRWLLAPIKYSVSATLVTVMSDSIPPFSSNISEYVTDPGVLETLLVVTLSNNAEASLPTTRNRMSDDMSYMATQLRVARLRPTPHQKTRWRPSPESWESANLVLLILDGCLLAIVDAP